jgi:signal transduction histidine kinase
VNGQSQVLEMITQGQPLAAILETIVRWVEAQSRDGVLASLVLLDREGKHLQHGAAPSLPKAYNELVNGVEIGPAVGSCGTAAFTRRPVIVEDIAHDPLWAGIRERALAHGLRACWSTPLIAGTGQVLGTFAMYYRQPRLPTPDDLQIIHLVTRTATLAIEHKQAEEEKEQLRLREQQALRRQEALRASERALQDANQRKDEFLSIASHELRTPLTSAKISVQTIARYLEGWLREPQPDAAVSVAQLEGLRTLLGRSECSLKRLERLVYDLLDLSRIQAGQLEMRPEHVDLVGVVREGVEEVAPAWPGCEVRLQRRLRALAGQAPEGPQGPVWVWVDPERIRQVVINYLSNALKYAPAEQPIDVLLEAPAGALRVDAGQRSWQHCPMTPMTRVSVRDQGPGLTAEQQAQLFERFCRVDGIAHQQGSGIGLGLGLYISRTIIERHGGRVGVQSVPGEGSTFWFTLPLAHTVLAESAC